MAGKPVSTGTRDRRVGDIRIAMPSKNMARHYVGRNGYAPFPSMIVEWNPQTVKRRRGKPLDVVLDIGMCIGGVYKAD